MKNKIKRPCFIDETPSEDNDDLIFKRAEILHENFPTEDLSENMGSPAENETPGMLRSLNAKDKVATPLKTISEHDSMSEINDYQHFLTKSKQKVSPNPNHTDEQKVQHFQREEDEAVRWTPRK